MKEVRFSAAIVPEKHESVSKVNFGEVVMVQCGGESGHKPCVVIEYQDPNIAMMSRILTDSDGTERLGFSGSIALGDVTSTTGEVWDIARMHEAIQRTYGIDFGIRDYLAAAQETFVHQDQQPPNAA